LLQIQGKCDILLLRKRVLIAFGGWMKKHFTLILIGIIILTVITFPLYNLFNDQTEFRHFVDQLLDPAL